MDRSQPLLPNNQGDLGGSRLGCEREIQRFSVLSCHQWLERGNAGAEEELREYRE